MVERYRSGISATEPNEPGRQDFGDFVEPFGSGHLFGKKSVAHRVTVRPVIVRHLNQIELSGRWNLSARTLERWRWLRQVPSFLKPGGRICYRVDDIEAFEVNQLQLIDKRTK